MYEVFLSALRPRSVPVVDVCTSCSNRTWVNDHETASGLDWGSGLLESKRARSVRVVGI